ncbi:MAG: hypothetical protein HZY75_13175 [Nocardioidaceae bacterium]|nr:MAG: hypothetical protein HZY75_13175 [Nocardioidaceae bacterium]
MSRPPLLPTQIASTDNEYSEGSPLLPAESLAATVADAVLKRGETPDINVAVMCTRAATPAGPLRLDRR